MSVLSNTLSPAILPTSSQCSQSVPVNCYSSSKLPISALSNTITTSQLLFQQQAFLSNTITTSRQSSLTLSPPVGFLCQSSLTPSPPVGFLCQSSLTLYHQQSCQLPPDANTNMLISHYQRQPITNKKILCNTTATSPLAILPTSS